MGSLEAPLRSPTGHKIGRLACMVCHITPPARPAPAGTVQAVLGQSPGSVPTMVTIGVYPDHMCPNHARTLGPAGSAPHPTGTNRPGALARRGEPGGRCRWSKERRGREVGGVGAPNLSSIMVVVVPERKNMCVLCLPSRSAPEGVRCAYGAGVGSGKHGGGRGGEPVIQAGVMSAWRDREFRKTNVSGGCSAKRVAGKTMMRFEI